MLSLTVPWCGPHCSQWHICKCTRGMWKAKWKPRVWGLRLSSGFRKWACLTCLYTACAQEHTHILHGASVPSRGLPSFPEASVSGFNWQMWLCHTLGLWASIHLIRSTPPVLQTFRSLAWLPLPSYCQLCEPSENQLISLNQKQWLSKESDGTNWWTKSRGRS